MDNIFQLKKKKFVKKEREKIKNFIKRQKKLTKLKTKPISNDTIQLFYDKPKNFFENHETLLNNTSYFDESYNSIFIHYFNVLYNISKNNNYSNSDIYLSNFDSFFKFHGKYLTIQDLALETPLHKIAKFRNKEFFITHYKKLKDIGAINEQILLVKNINENSCLDLIIKEIEVNRNKFLNNNRYKYKYFIKNNWLIVETLSKSVKRNLNLFSLLINFDEKLYKGIKFDEIYTSLNNLFQIEKEKIFEYDYFNQNINILNCLFHFCRLSDSYIDFNKLFLFISNLLEENVNQINKIEEKIKTKNKIKQNTLQKYIYNHIGYVLGKIKMEDKTNTNEKSKINEYNIAIYKTEIYSSKLIDNILPILLDNYSFDELKDKEKTKKMIKLKFNINSLVINLAKNPYLNFEQKYKKLNSLEGKLKEHFDEDSDEDVIYLYKFFKLCKQNTFEWLKSNITSLFKKHKFIRKIFIDNFFIVKLYSAIFSLCNKYDKINLHNYIKKLGKFLRKNKKILNLYKYTYSMNDNNILLILNVIISFEEKNYKTGIEIKYFDNNVKKLDKINEAKFKQLFKQFIISDPNLIFYTLKDIIYKSQNGNKKIRQNLYIDFLDLFFSFKYDFQKFISNKNINSYFSHKDIDEFRLYEKKLKENLPFIKGHQYEFSIYNYILKYSPHINNIFIFNYTIARFKILMKKYYYQLVLRWNEDCDFSELANLIKENILPFCKLFLDIKDSFEDRKNKINFFFDAFIQILFEKYKFEELDNEFKTEKYQNYKQLSLNYLHSNEDYEYFYNLNYKIYFTMMLIFITLKYGKFNPHLLLIFISKYKTNNDAFLLFLKAYYNNDNKNDILNHFFLLDINTYLLFPDKYKFKYKKNVDYFSIPEFSWKEMLLTYITLISSKLKYIKYSLIFDYIKSFINSNGPEYNNKSDNDVLNSFKYILLSISLEQHKNLFKTIFDAILIKKIIKTFFCFLDIDPILYTEENINHKIKVLNQMSSYSEDKIENTEYIFEETVNEKTLKNIIKILAFLHKENNSLLNCLKNNRYLLKISLNYLLKSYFFYIIQETKKNSFYLSLENEDSDILKNEIYNFLNFYKINCNKEFIFDFSQIFFSFYKYEDFIYFIKQYINTNIYSCKIQILNNYGAIDISFFKSILEKDLLMLFLIYAYIIQEKNVENNINKDDKYDKNKELNNLGNDSNNKGENIFNIKNNEIYFILNYYSGFLINKNIKQIYEQYLPIFDNINQFNFESKNDIRIFNENELNNIYFTLVFIYISQVYPSYDPSLLYYIYTKFYTIDSKRFFINFMNCIKDKENQNNIQIHLFLEKYENNFDNKNNITNLKKICKDLYNKKISLKTYIVKYFLNVNYSRNSFFFEYIDKKIEKAFEKNNLQNIDYIIYYYSSDKNKDIYNKLCDKFLQLKIPFYHFLEYNINFNNEEKMIKTIQLLENLSKNTIKNYKDSQIYEEEGEDRSNSELLIWSKELKEKINEKIRKEKYNELFEIGNMVELLSRKYFLMKNEKIKKEKLHNKLSNKYNNVVNKIINLYTFFRVLKKLNRNLIDIINGNYYFLRETIEILLVHLNYTLCSSYNPNIIKEIKDKKQTDYLNEKIYDFFRVLFINEVNNDILSQYLKNPIVIENQELEIKLLRFFENGFIKRIQKLKTDNIPEDEFQPYKQIIIKFCKPYFNNYSFRKTFSLLFEKDFKKFIDLFSADNFHTLYLKEIIILLIRNNFKKLLSEKDFSKLNSFDKIINNNFNLDNYNIINKIISKYILNNAEEEIYSKLDFINNSFLFHDLDTSLFCLNNIYNRIASIFVINKIQNKFNEINTNVKLFIELIKRQINNNFVFDYLFNLFNENEINELFQNNKNLIVISLYRYSEINGFKYIEAVINKLNKFMPLDELKKIISPNFEKEEKLPDYIISFFDDLKNKNQKENNKLILNKDENKINDDINRYLLFYALLNPLIPNYETIALFLEICQFENVIYNLFSFFSDNFKSLYNIKIMKLLNYISNKLNKERIKNLGNNLLSFIEFVDKIRNVLLYYYEGLNDFEKMIFYDYIIINILQITPKKLIKLLGINNIRDISYDVISKNTVGPNYNLSEAELFIILTLYEIRGSPIISIKKYLPIFYNKVENLYYKFERFNIPKMNLTKIFDIKIYEQFVNIITTETKKFLENIPYPSYKNFFLIIQKEFSLNIDDENEKYLDNYLFELIEKENIISYKNNELLYLNIKDLYYRVENYRGGKKKTKGDKNNQNFKDDKKELVIPYKYIIYSLLDFNEVNIYFIKNNSTIIKKNEYGEKSPLNLYIFYLETIKDIYHYIIYKKENNSYSINIFEEYNITPEIETRLEKMKKNININTIISEIIKTYENLEINQNEFFNYVVKWINNYINSKNEIMKGFNKISKEKNNIISYFKFLAVNCNIIIRAIEIFDKIIDILNYSIIDDSFLHINIEFHYSKDKIISKKNSGESLYEIVNNFFYLVDNSNNEKYEGKYKVYFYFDEQKENFYETCSEIDLITFIKSKSHQIKSFFNKYFDEKNPYDILEERIFNYIIKIPENIKKQISSTFFNSFLEENQNLLSTYAKNTVCNINQLNYDDFLFFIKEKIDKIVFNILSPCLSFNYKIYSLLDFEKEPQLVFKEPKTKKCFEQKDLHLYNYNDYININEIISSIMETQYHSNNILNSSFQIKAINYIINGDSYFSNFIFELYKSSFNKVIKRYPHYNNIDYKKFRIKIEKGKIYTLNDLSMEKGIEKKEPKLEKDNKDNSSKKVLKPQEKIQYKLCKYDTDYEYSNNYFPFKQIYYFNGKEFKHQEFKDIYKRKKFKISEVNNFNNVYDLIFTVKYVDKDNIIYLEKNDITELLKPYLKEETFISLLNSKFYYKAKEDEEEKIDMIIKDYLKNKFK